MPTPLHPRQEIREAAAAALVGTAPDYNTAADARVYETRTVPFQQPGFTLPAIAVYSLEESSDDNDTAPRELTRTLQLAIEAAVAPGTNVDDTLDAICLEIERAMHADSTLDGTCSDCILASTELDFFENGAKSMGLAHLVYTVTYYTYAPEAADVVLEDLETVTTAYDLEGEQDTADQANDLIEDLDV